MPSVQIKRSKTLRVQQHPVLMGVLVVSHLLVDDPAGLLDGLLKSVAEQREQV